MICACVDVLVCCSCLKLYLFFSFSFFFFFNDTATTEIYTLSLHDALPICWRPRLCLAQRNRSSRATARSGCRPLQGDRKSTRLNSSHLVISYAVFCLKKKKKKVNKNNFTNESSERRYDHRRNLVRHAGGSV